MRPCRNYHIDVSKYNGEAARMENRTKICNIYPKSYFKAFKIGFLKKVFYSMHRVLRSMVMYSLQISWIMNERVCWMILIKQKVICTVV